MQSRWIPIIAALVLPAHGCKSSVDCGEGTIERAGVCEPADQTVSAAKCGPFTELQGDQCVPMFDPTVCDPATTEADIDPATGVTTCIGTGMGGCSAPLACPQPATGKQTICGQLFDFENNQAFAAPNATGAECPTTPTADGPCSLHINAYDAIEFGTNPMTAAPRTTGPVYIDDCGRYRVPDIEVPSGPFVGLGIDDASGNVGPAGTTNAVGVATPKVPSTATRDFDAFIVKGATTTKWATSSGGQTIAGGYFAPVYRSTRAGRDTAPGVTVIRNGASVPANDYYFSAAQVTREAIDPTATATGANGTALFIGAMLGQGFSGSGGLPAECVWSTHAGVTIPGVVFIQIFRPTNAMNQTCPL